MLLKKSGDESIVILIELKTGTTILREIQNNSTHVQFGVFSYLATLFFMDSISLRIKGITYYDKYN